MDDTPAERLVNPSRMRMNIYVDPTTRKAIHALRVAMHATSASETIRRAVKIARVVADAQIGGSTVLIVRPDGEADRVVLEL